MEALDDEFLLKHFLYFSNHEDAEKAAKRLREEGFKVEVDFGGDGVNWLTLAGHNPLNDEEADKARERIDALAAELHGEYDGWEIKVS